MAKTVFLTALETKKRKMNTAKSLKNARKLVSNCAMKKKATIFSEKHFQILHMKLQLIILYKTRSLISFKERFMPVFGFYNRRTLKDIKEAVDQIPLRNEVKKLSNEIGFGWELSSSDLVIVKLKSSEEYSELFTKYKMIISNSPFITMASIHETSLVWKRNLKSPSIFLSAKKTEDEEIVAKVIELFNSPLAPFLIIDCTSRITKIRNLIKKLNDSNRLILCC